MSENNKNDSVDIFSEVDVEDLKKQAQIKKPKKYVNKFYVLVLIVGVMSNYFLFFSSRTEKKENKIISGAQEEKIAEELRELELIKNFANKYQAITDWDQDLDYTIQAQERLITDKPILFRGYINDIFNRDGKTILRFSADWSGHYNDIFLDLNCDKSILTKVLSEKSHFDLDEYTIIANIRDVSRAVFALTSSISISEEVETNIASSDLFVAKGDCVDIVDIKDLFNKL